MWVVVRGMERAAVNYTTASVLSLRCCCAKAISFHKFFFDIDCALRMGTNPHWDAGSEWSGGQLLRQQNIPSLSIDPVHFPLKHYFSFTSTSPLQCRHA